MKVTNATILLFPFFLFACNNKNNLENEVRLFAGQTISIEKDSLFNPYYSHNNIHSSTPYTYVIYSDADNCSECTINHIDDWSDLDMEKYVQKGLLSYMFILAPEKSQLSRIKKLLEKKELNGYAIYVDTCGYFERSNDLLPSNHLLHTFMIDRTNKVVLIGNPIGNSRIKDICIRIVSGNH